MKTLKLNEEEVFMLKIAINYILGKGVRDLIQFENLKNKNEEIKVWIKETKKEFEILSNLKAKLKEK